MIAKWLKDHFEWVWHAVFTFSLAPAVVLLIRYMQDDLGANPLAELLHTTGSCSLNLLTITLAVTPVRKWAASAARATHLRFGKRLADWNWLIRLRRQLGLWCFFYATCHAGIYVALDLGFDWAAGWQEIIEKPYLAAGLVSLTLLLPLAATSTTRMIRVLGRHWRRLHMLTYVVAIMGLLHFWWMQKPGVFAPWPVTVALVILLGYRVLIRSGLLTRWEGDDGSESPDRPLKPRQTGDIA